MGDGALPCAGQQPVPAPWTGIVSSRTVPARRRRIPRTGPSGTARGEPGRPPEETSGDTVSSLRTSGAAPW